jgi:hypothetical protein
MVNSTNICEIKKELEERVMKEFRAVFMDAYGFCEGIFRIRNEKLFDMLSESKFCSCGRKIWFLKTKAGKAMPVTDEGLSHFADCPDAEKYRKTELP